MQLRKKITPQKLALNIAPLIDVIFLLIIFFMTLSQSNSEVHPRVELPQTVAHNTPTGSDAKVEIVITINANNEIIIKDETVTMASLKEYLEVQITQTKPYILYVRIRSDKKTPWHWVSEMMTICAKLDINQVNIGVQNTKVSR